MATKKSTQNEAPTEAGAGAATPATPKGLVGFGLFLWHFLLGVGSRMGSVTLPILGTTYTAATLTTKVQGFLAPYAQLAAQLAEVAATRAAIKANEAAAKLFMKAASAAVKGWLGETSPDLSDFGIDVAKVKAPLTPEQLVMRTAKANATRKVRHTMSRKQKKALKSTVTPMVSVSVPASAPAETSIVSTGAAPSPSTVAAAPASAPAAGGGSGA